MKPASEVQLAEEVTRLMHLLRQLSEFASGYFLAKIEAARTIREWYDAVLALDYAANGKELRDTDDERVHALCRQITEVIDWIEPFFRVKLYPCSAAQAQRWKARVARNSLGKYTFRRDGAIEASVMDARLRGDRLWIGRIWADIGSFSGVQVNLRIRLHPSQIADMRSKFAQFRLVQETIMNA
ncbi:hypothetical protein [uncultured Massilia sp.]|uniref:hypothetical protein n=1 Tax=uncultured Massilia sp. TaxID=169973 RepID=UPI00258A6BDE|nr:hypothetical protein [uncultured Massilia sp.]